jgi:hypothetical protein
MQGRRSEKLYSQAYILFLSVMMLLLAAGSARAKPPAKPTSCPIKITACGCVITHADTYLALNDLNATQSNHNCIEIAASNSILNLKGFSLFGKNDGTGTGILIDKSAKHVIVEGGDKTGPQATVSAWNIGVEDDGDGAVIGRFEVVGTLLIPPNLGNTTGVFLKAVYGSIVTALNANGNKQFGVLFSNTTGASLINVSANRNNQAGLKLDSSTGNSIGPGGMESNGTYGIWLQSSSGNTIRDSNGNQFNNDTGIRLAGGSNKNRIASGGAPNNGKAGIVITLGSTGNTVTVTHNPGNGNPNSDMVDLNPNCDSNVWYNNLGNPSQACIK